MTTLSFDAQADQMIGRAEQVYGPVGPQRSKLVDELAGELLGAKPSEIEALTQLLVVTLANAPAVDIPTLIARWRAGNTSGVIDPRDQATVTLPPTEFGPYGLAKGRE